MSLDLLKAKRALDTAFSFINNKSLFRKQFQLYKDLTVFLKRKEVDYLNYYQTTELEGRVYKALNGVEYGEGDFEKWWQYVNGLD